MADTPSAAPASAPQSQSPFTEQPVKPSAPTQPSDADYERMSPVEKLSYARAATAAAEQGAGDVRASEGDVGDGAKIKVGDGENAIEFTERELRDLAANKAAEDSRKATLPATPDA